MSIGIGNYVLVTSAVAASGGVARRDLIGRLFSENAKTPTNAAVEFTTAAAVGQFYGTTSLEYLRAVFYFGFISKGLTSPKKLSFGRFARTASPARIYGAAPIASLATLKAITAGTLTLTIGGEVATLTNLNFAAANAYADVAATLQTAIRAVTGLNFATATVTYDAVNGVFNLAASSTQAVVAAITASGTVLAPLGWSTGAVYSPGTPVQTIADALTASAGVSNNFGSFAFVQALSDAEITAAAQWNAARNVDFIFCAPFTASNASSLSAALIGLLGTAPTLTALAAEYDEMLPMMVLAATDYSRRNAVQNYMFQQANLSPKVSTDASASLYDGLRVNYYGVTQTAGQQLAFYQRGVMTGTPTAPVDINVYANEIWLRDAAASALMALLISVGRLPANAAGLAQVRAVLQDPIDQALLNGTISVDKPLTTAQKLFITDITGEELAWQEVATVGYWADAVIQSFTTTDGRTEFKIVYTLVYSKDDAVRKIEGSHILV